MFFRLLCVSVRFECSCFSVFSVSILVLGSVDNIPCSFVGIFRIFQSQKTNLSLLSSQLGQQVFDWLS